MAALIALALHAQPVITTPVPPPLPPTVNSVNRPAFDLACSLVDESLNAHAVQIEQRGGRGYVDSRFDQLERRFRTTRLSFRVVRDETGLFSDENLMGVNNGYRIERIEGRHPQFGVVRLETFHAGRDRLAALVYVNALADVRYTGFCAVTRHEQTPLTEAETAEVFNQ